MPLVGRGLLEYRVHVSLGNVDGRDQRENDTGECADQHGEQQHDEAQMDLLWPLQIRRFQRQQQVNSKVRYADSQ